MENTVKPFPSTFHFNPIVHRPERVRVPAFVFMLELNVRQFTTRIIINYTGANHKKDNEILGYRYRVERGQKWR